MKSINMRKRKKNHPVKKVDNPGTNSRVLRNKKIELERINSIRGGSRDAKSWINQAEQILKNKMK